MTVASNKKPPPRRVRLSDRTIVHLRAPARGQIVYWDSELKGFGLRVAAGGTRSWVAVYRRGRSGQARAETTRGEEAAAEKPRRSPMRWLTIGRYPQMSLKAAREAARDAFYQARRGADPASEWRRIKLATFRELAELYIKRHAKPKKKSWREDERLLAREVLPAWGARALDEIRRRDVAALLDRIVDRGAPIQANRVLALVRKVFNFAIQRDIVEANPAARLPLPGKERRRDRVLSAEEIATVWEAFGDVPLAGDVGDALAIQLATAQRIGEVLAMRWSEIDLEAAVWTIPEERSKNRLAHRVPLTEPVLEILERRRFYQEDRRQRRAEEGGEERGPEPYVFASPRGDGPIRWARKAIARIRERTGVEFRSHDLRRTAASWMASQGVGRVVLAKVLNHAEPGVTSVYDRHSYDTEKREALERWAAWLAEVLQRRRRP